MNKKIYSLVIVAVAALVAVVGLVWLLSQGPGVAVKKSLPGMDGRGDALHVVKKELIEIGALFVEGEVKGKGRMWERESVGEGERSALRLRSGYSGFEEWPRFRGGDYSNIATQNVPLANSWPESGPAQLWSIELGEGHAAPAVYNGRVYLLDYDEEKRADMLRCISLAEGKDIWRRGYKIHVKRNHGMSRTVPAVNDKYVVTIGPRCHVMCVDALSGDFYWGLDLEKDFGTEVPLWYTGQCPVIDDNIAVIAPAGSEILMMGIDCGSGKTVWQTPNVDKWQMSHSSVMLATIAEKRMYVYCALGGMVGVSAEDNDRGKILWKTSEWKHKVTAPSPVVMNNGLIMINGGYGAGSMLFKVDETDGEFSIKTLQTVKTIEGVASEQQTPIYYKNHLFTILPKDAGALRKEFACCKEDDLTRIVWSSGKVNRFGLGPYLLADRKFYILNDNGVLTMIKASTESYQQLGQAKVLDGHDAWGPIALVGTKMLLRDSKSMICIEVGE